jgi:RNA polymerase sigma factor (TIGR02999 family)
MPVATDTPGGLTTLFDHIAGGDDVALGTLWQRVHVEVRAMADRLLGREYGGATLDPTEVVNEAWIRLHGRPGGPPQYRNRAHFFGAVARAMGQVLVDRARRRGAVKRGGDRSRVPFDEVLAGGLGQLDDGHREDFEAALQAMADLEAELPRAADIVWLKLVAGLSADHVADVLGLAARTVRKDYAFAISWLRRRVDRVER